MQNLLLAGIGVRTVRILHNILHKALDKAVRYRMVIANPAHGAELPRYRHGEMLVLDEAQVTQFLVAAHDSPFLALYQLAITTGMRQGELLGLKWTDLQWHSGTLHVQRQVQDIRGHGRFFKSPRRERDVEQSNLVKRRYKCYECTGITSKFRWLSLVISGTITI